MAALRLARALIFTTVLSIINLRAVFAEDPCDAKSWTDSHATFYGGDSGQGTMGGACGYGNLIDNGYGYQNAALSQALFNSGLTCGACFEIQCKVAESKWCYADGGSITVTATNFCPPNLARVDDGWCNPPRTHFDLSYPIFSQLAQKVGGIIPVQYRRVPCVRKGGIRYQMDGNPWFNLVLVLNVGGAGNVVSLNMKGSDTDFYPMTQNWGQRWELREKLAGKAVSFRAALGDGSTLTSTDVCPESWSFGQSYECINNF